MKAIRGAICAQNTKDDIAEKSVTLVRTIFEKNSLKKEDITAIIFTATKDLFAEYPAKSVRLQLDLPNVAFLCLQEMFVENSLNNCIRVCVFAEGTGEATHCYLGEAQKLRADIK